MDTMSIALPQTAIPLPGIEKELELEDAENASKVLDMSQNSGNKPIFGTGYQRLQAFSNWVFGREEETIIAAGHSLWFRHFFKTYLPKDLKHDANTYKIENCGVVAFDFEKDPHSDRFAIDVSSISVVYGGFEKKTPKKSKKNN